MPSSKPLGLAKKISWYQGQNPYFDCNICDTGKAALEGFYNTEDIDILVLYPTEGVSSIQKAQMDTTGSLNSRLFPLMATSTMPNLL
ncbi:hypothetical protein [Peptoniphilus harei]|uniref:hypothetical protein n=1 Tax=Peptoniphilus harei TaxID=54005 RepID=UPI00211546E0|nr:hypothetical protein [Peptoniphilus harei]